MELRKITSVEELTTVEKLDEINKQIPNAIRRDMGTYNQNTIEKENKRMK